MSIDAEVSVLARALAETRSVPHKAVGPKRKAQIGDVAALGAPPQGSRRSRASVSGVRRQDSAAEKKNKAGSLKNYRARKQQTRLKKLGTLDDQPKIPRVLRTL
jgi:hypothetical protein